MLSGAAVRQLVVARPRIRTGASRANTRRMISMYSRRRVSGLAYDAPYQPSTTCGPEGPSPTMKRPPESWSSDIAVIAAIVGVRAGSCMIAVPTRILRRLRQDPRGGRSPRPSRTPRRSSTSRSRAARPPGSGHRQTELLARVADDHPELHAEPSVIHGCAAQVSRNPRAGPRRAACYKRRAYGDGQDRDHARVPAASADGAAPAVRAATRAPSARSRRCARSRRSCCWSPGAWLFALPYAGAARVRGWPGFVFAGALVAARARARGARKPGAARARARRADALALREAGGSAACPGRAWNRSRSTRTGWSWSSRARTRPRSSSQPQYRGVGLHALGRQRTSRAHGRARTPRDASRPRMVKLGELMAEQ